MKVGNDDVRYLSYKLKNKIQVQTKQKELGTKLRHSFYGFVFGCRFLR